MRRLLLACLALAAWLATGPLAAQPVRGFIVQLRDSGAQAPQRARDQLEAVARAEGLGLRGQAALGRRHHLLRLAQPLRGAALDSALRRLRLRPEVASVEPDVVLRRMALPNDPGFSQQWELQSPFSFPSALNMPPAWDRTTGHPGVTVAVLDSGILKNHPDIAGRFWPGYDFVSDVDAANDGDGRDADSSDPGDWVSGPESQTPAFQGCQVEDSSWHGTFIAGQIAATTNNLQGVAGINWNSRILPVRVAGKCGALLSDLVAGLLWSAGLPVEGVPANPNPARVVNISFGGDAPCASGNVYQEAIDSVTAAGTLVVVASGNGFGQQVTRPADCRGVLAVGAVRQDGLKTSYSSIGPSLGLMAPGGPLFSLTNAGLRGPGADSYGFKEGSSFSSPQAAGVASLMLSLNPALGPAQLIARMRAAARPHAFNPSFATCSNASSVNTACNCTVATCGAGLLDANRATQLALDPVAAIAPVPSPPAGTTIALDGSASAAASGSRIATWQWSQLSGPVLVLAGASQPVASVALPAQSATFAFLLTVVDEAGRTDQATLTVVSVAASGNPPAAGGGGGATDWLWGAGLWLVALCASWRRRKPA